MRKSISQLGFSKIANTQVNRLEQFDKLKEIANRNNYPHKIKQLTAKVQEEYNFWNVKNPSRKLEDITRDLIFIKSIRGPILDKERINELIEKYGLK
jgi:hypothetical protein